jgi:N-acetylglucosaminyldiphosphoundecaprenol N-acetyl-beta-D-mannosaminyltransferase
MSRIFLLGIPIDAVTRAQAVTLMHNMLMSHRQCHVTTPNNEMLVQASRMPAFAKVLRATALNLPDSTGLLLASRLNGTPLPQRVTGVDTVTELCGGFTVGMSVFLLGAGDKIAARAAIELTGRNPRLHIAGAYSGSPRDEDAAAIVGRINASGARLLLVAFGSPAQDLWIARHLSSMPNVRVAMGVGGTFDFLAGSVKRAPRMLRALGLEWAWRFALQPSRARRMFDALIVFPWLVLRNYPRSRAGRRSR